MAVGDGLDISEQLGRRDSPVKLNKHDSGVFGNYLYGLSRAKRTQVGYPVQAYTLGCFSLLSATRLV
jgi:hypothetical protein